jgi:hypothetical protein
MNAVSLNNLWSYLQGLSLTASNKRWLGERLIEASTEAKAKSVKATNRQHHRAHKRSKALSDKELAARLAQYAPLTDADFPELSKEDFENFVKYNGGRITKGLEKWL